MFRGPIEAVSLGLCLTGAITTFRGLCSAAPLKHSIATLGQKSTCHFPRTMFRGPIEACCERHPCASLHPFPRTMFRGPIEALMETEDFNSPVWTFRGLCSAAPLKRRVIPLRVNSAPPFRGLCSAAPLKPTNADASAAAALAFRGLCSAAPLKHSRSENPAPGIAPFRELCSAAPLKLDEINVNAVVYSIMLLI